MSNSDTIETIDWVTPEQIARAVGVTGDAVRRWARNGHIRATRPTPGSPYLITREAAEEFLRPLGVNFNLLDND